MAVIDPLTELTAPLLALIAQDADTGAASRRGGLDGE
jgi:hypothetical protein